ncbi:MAG: hypothetical protein Q8P05_01580 [Candidatus Diapherotrites archaeon]|nr:hypothetical protein [Candidatus Diapherotrites archaeon]MDZ4256269.1 hypothetical protein [archaeon]
MHLRIAIVVLVFLTLASSAWAWGFYYTDTWNSNQVLVSAYSRPAAYGNWVYPMYNHLGYPTLGGGRIYAYPSYNMYPSYAPYGTSYAYGASYPGHYVAGYAPVPIHTTTPSFQYYGYYGR